MGDAVLDGLTAPVRVESGVITDGVQRLHERGLLIDATGAYLLGTERMYQWADGRPLLAGLAHTHDVTRLASRQRFVAVNAALEVDLTGAVNVEGIAHRNIAGVGGQPDYALGAAQSRGGLSIMALPTRRNGTPTLVATLAAPTSTVRYDVDLVVTERGSADLRGLTDAERSTTLQRLWDGAVG
jgi:acyl-CoA hydrolase